MTFEEFLENLARIDGPHVFTMSPGPYKLQIGDMDGEAAAVLLEQYNKFADSSVGEAEIDLIHSVVTLANQGIIAMDELPEEERVPGMWFTKDVEVLFHAWWWLVFWQAQYRGDDDV